MPSVNNIVYLSTEQQGGLLGHCILDGKIYEQAVIAGVTWQYFDDDHQGRIWKDLETLVTTLHRHPTRGELEASLRDGPEMLRRLKLEVEQAVAKSRQLGLDTLIPALRQWASGIAVRTDLTGADDDFNRGDLWKVVSKVHLLSQKLHDLERLEGAVNRFENARERLKGERAERLELRKRIMPTGISFLDEVLAGGIAPHDLVVIGARTGVGKTQLMTIVAANVCGIGKRVAFFALEAEEREIERRIKFSIVSDLYREKYPVAANRPTPYLEYMEWSRGQYDEMLGDEIEDEAEKVAAQRLDGLQTFYRTRGDFDVNDLDTKVSAIARDVDLIIVDHLHYVDTDERNENAEVKKIVKRLRDLALSYGVPILLVAHLRKPAGGKDRPLLPAVEDFHGSSDIVKIAKVAVMLGPAKEINWAQEHIEYASPTYMSLVKCRDAGERAKFTAVVFFDHRKMKYGPLYALGQLTDWSRNWEPIANRPLWATSSKIDLLPTDNDR